MAFFFRESEKLRAKSVACDMKDTVSDGWHRF
jgi:hypothetical protein